MPEKKLKALLKEKFLMKSCFINFPSNTELSFEAGIGGEVIYEILKKINLARS